MRNSEKEYWNKVFDHLKNRVLKENVWKRAKIMRHLLAHDYFQKKILEIGCGSGSVPIALDRIYLSMFTYVGTDISDIACEYNKGYGFNVYNTDITNLPAIQDGYDYIFAFDVLEHVNIKDRESGYKEMMRVLKDDGRVLINNPLCESLHEDEFDPGLDESDLEEMQRHGFRIDKREVYYVACNGLDLSYEWIEMVKS